MPRRHALAHIVCESLAGAVEYPPIANAVVSINTNFHNIRDFDNHNLHVLQLVFLSSS